MNENGTLLHTLRLTGQAISDAADAAQVGQALMAFAPAAGLDVARLLMFGGRQGGNWSYIEMREGWTIDDRPAQPYGTRLPLDGYPLLAYMRPDQPLVVEDVTADPRVNDLVRQFMAISGVQSFVVLPLCVRERWLGAFFLGRNLPSTYPDDLIAIAWTLSCQAVVALQNLERLEALTRKDVEQSALIDNMPDGIYFKDTKSRFTRINSGQAALLGLDSVEDGVGKTDADFFAPQFADLALADEQRILESRQPMVGRIEKIILQDGREYWYSATKLPLTDDQGRVIGLVGISRDITELKAAQDAAQHRATELQLAADISKAAGSVLDPDELIRQAVDLIRDRFELYYVGMFLADATGEWAVLRAGTGEAGRTMMARGHRLQIGGQSMIGWCVANAQARIALDVGEEAVRFENPLLPETRSELALPLLSRGQAIGALTIQSTRQAAFGDEDITALQTMADQLATAIGNARLFQERERRLAEMAVVNDIGRALSSSVELDDLLEMIYQQVSRLFDVTNFYIATYEEGSGEWFSALHLERGVRVPQAWRSIETGMTGHILRTRRPILFGTPEECRAFEREQGLAAIGDIPRSWLAVPMIAADKCVGALSIQTYQADHEYDEHDLALFTTVAGQVAVAVDNLRLLAAARRRAQEMEAINEVGRAVTSVVDLDSVLRQIVDITKERFGSYFVSLLLVEGDRLVYRDGSTIGDSGVRLEPGTVVLDLGTGLGLTAQAVRTGQPVLAHDVRQEPQFLDMPELALTRSELDVPVRSKGQVIGALTMQSDRPHAYDQEMATLVQSLADQAGVAIENAQLFDRTETSAVEAARLYEAGRRLTAAQTPNDILSSVLEFTHPLDLDRCLIALLDDPEVPPADRRVTVVAVWDRAGREDISLNNRFGPAQVPPIATLGPTERMIVEDFDTADVDERMRATFRYLGVGATAILPMAVGGRLLGWLLAETIGRARHFGERELNGLQSVAGQAAVALENQRLLEESRSRAQELAAINEVGRAVTSVLDLDTVLRQIVDIVKARFGYYYVGINLVEGDTIRHGASSTIGDSDTRLPIDELQIPISRAQSLMAEAARTRQPVLVHDVSTDPHYMAVPSLAAIGSELDVPIIAKDAVIGVLAIQSDRPFEQPERVIRLVQALCDQAAVAIDNARLFQSAQRAEAEQRQRSEELAALQRASVELAEEQRDLTTVLQAISRRAMDLLGSDGGGVWLWREEDQELELVLDYQVDGMHFAGRRLKMGEGLSGRALADRKVQVIDDYLAWNGHAESFSNAPFSAGMAAPMVWQNQPVGVMVVTRSQPGRAYGSSEQSLAELLAAQATAFIQNARLFEEARLHAQELDILNEMGQTLSQMLDVAAVVDNIREFTGRLMDVTSFYVALYDAEQDTVSFPLFIDDNVLVENSSRQAGTGMTEHVIRTRQPLLVREEVIAAQEELGIRQHGKQSLCWLGVPMMIGGQPIGVIAVQSYTVPRLYDEHDRDLLLAVAAQAAIAIQNSRLFEDARRRAEELDVLNEMDRALSGTLSVDGVVEVAYQHAGRLLDATNLYVGLYDAARDMIRFPIYAEEGNVKKGQDRPAGKGLTEYILNSRQPLLIREDMDGNLAKLGIEGIGRDALSWLGVPMMIGDRVTGVIAVQSYTTPRLYDEHDQGLLSAIAGQVAIALENARLFEEQQRTAALLAGRVRQLDCLNDIGRKVQDTPPIAAFMTWMAGRLPQAMQFPAICHAAVEFEGQVYGEPAALALERQMAHSLHTGGRTAGRVVIAYNEEREFLDEESALLGEIVRRADGYVENRRLVEETEQGARRLAEERALLRTLIDNLPDIVFVKDRASRFLISNQAHLATLGAAREEEILGQTGFERHPQELAAGLYGDEQGVLSRGEAIVDRQESVVDPQRGRRWLLTTKLPLRDSQGEVTGLVGISRDITSRVEFEEALRRRGEQLQCLSDIGQRIGEAPPVAEFLAWVAGRIPAAMRYAELCLAAIQLEDQVYGSAEAVTTPCQIVQSLQPGGRRVGRIVIAYREAREFLDEESALLGDVARRVSGYIENQRLLQETQARAAMEARIRAATDRIRRSTNVEAILRTGSEELAQVLGVSTLVVRLGTAEQLGTDGGDGGT